MEERRKWHRQKTVVLLMRSATEIKEMGSCVANDNKERDATSFGVDNIDGGQL